MLNDPPAEHGSAVLGEISFSRCGYAAGRAGADTGAKHSHTPQITESGAAPKS